MTASLDSKNFEKQLFSIINIDPELMSGTPVFRGTRVPIQFLFDWLEESTIEDFIENYDSVSHEQAIGLLKLAGVGLLSARVAIENKKSKKHEVAAGRKLAQKTTVGIRLGA